MNSWRYLIWLCVAVPATFVALAYDARAQDVAIAAQFEGAGNFHKGVAPALMDKRWGLIDRKGSWVVSPRYASIGVGSGGLFAVQTDGAWGYVNAKGQLVIDRKFEAAEPFDNGVAAVKMNGRWGYVRPNGATETRFMFLEVGGREGPFVSARDAEGWAVFQLSANGPPKRDSIASDPAPQRAYSISERSIIAKFPDEDRIYLINDSQGKDGFYLEQRFWNWNNPTRYISILRVSEGFAPAATAPDKWGYLHRASEEFLWPGRFESALGFTQDLGAVKLNGKWGYIDRAGRVIVQPTYDAAFPFRGEYAVIRQDEKRGFLRIGPQGGISVFITPRYEDAFRFTEGLAPVKIDGRWGYVSDGQPWSELRDAGIANIQPR